VIKIGSIVQTKVDLRKGFYDNSTWSQRWLTAFKFPGELMGRVKEGIGV